MKLIKHLFLITIISFTYACSSSDGGSESAADKEGIPSGEIVAKELRDETLTGFPSVTNKFLNDKNAAQQNSQKWWTHVNSAFKFSGNCGEDTEDEVYTNQGYVALTPNGDILYKTLGGVLLQQTRSWEWTDSNKTAIYLDGERDLAFKITYLNKDNVVYGFNEIYEGCTGVSYEEFNSPFFE